jgi:hypothetical protein
LVLRFIWIGKLFDMVMIKMDLLDSHWKKLSKSDDEKYEKLIDIVDLFDQALRFGIGIVIFEFWLIFFH